jgi:hypothetical protein
MNFNIGNAVIHIDHEGKKQVGYIVRIEEQAYSKWNTNDDSLAVYSVGIKSYYESELFELEPIPLSNLLIDNDGLECIGLTRNSNARDVDFFSISKDNFMIALHREKNVFSVCLDDDNSFMALPNKIEYLHELQNLLSVFGMKLKISKNIIV